MLALLLAIAAPPVEPAAPRHHGFFLHADLGFGYFSSRALDASMTGVGAGLGLGIGAGVAENLAIYATLFDAVTAAPTVTVKGVQSRPNNWSVGTAGFGAGATYYFMPANVFITAMAGAGPLTIMQGSTTFTSHTGFVGRVGVGKEWLVSRSWGLGAALLLNIGIHADQDPNGQTWTTLAPLLGLSATFY